MKTTTLLIILLVFIIGCTQEPERPSEAIDSEVEKQQIANPASVYCEEQGGILRIETEEAGQYGICTLPDGTECEEWAYFRGECPEKDITESKGLAKETTPDAVTMATPSHPNLIAHWKFEDNAKDAINDYEGKIMGNAEFDAGKKGKAIYFDGIDDYVDLSQDALNDVGSLSQGTIAFWFKFQSILDKQTVMPIFYIGANEKEDDNIFIIEVGHFNLQGGGTEPDPSNKMIYTTWINNQFEPFLCFDSDVNLAENKWHHFAVVVSKDGNTGYLNGNEITNRHYNFGNSKDPSFLDDIPNKKKLMLGYGRSSHLISPDFVYFKGALDDFRIYNEPLGEEEIMELVR